MPAEIYSMEHERFVRKEKLTRGAVTAARYLILAAFIGAWELLAAAGVLDTFIFSSPSRIAKTIVGFIQDGSLWINVGTTTLEAAAGFIISTLIGTFAAALLWWFPLASRTLDPYLVILNAVPKIALGPVLIVWLGANEGSIVMIAVLVSVFVTITSVLSGFVNQSREKTTLMRSFGATKWQLFYMVILPASVPTIVAALKLNVGMAWVGVIVGEFLVSRAGLGYLAVYGGQVFKLDIVMTAVVLLCVAAAGMYMLVAKIEKRLTR